MNYILIGMPDSGKSTLGKKAAAVLGLQFYDTDKLAMDYIRSKYQSPSYFDFRREIFAAEAAVVRRVAKEAKNAIIATGAETALSIKNVQVLRKSGRFIYIKRDPDLMLKEILERFVPDPARPEMHDARELGVHLYRNILPEYERLADITLENDSGEEVGLETLIKIIRTEILANPE
jgi:shikimate kinase